MLIRIIICFAFGSIPFAVIAMMGSGIDIRAVGSGNPGFNNVLRVSKPRAAVALAGDMGKGVAALLLTRPGVSARWELWVLAFAAILGHCYSPLLRFKGGKGIATSGGVMLVLDWRMAVIALAYFVAARVAGSKIFHLREAGAIASLSSWVLFTVLMLSFRSGTDAIAAVLISAFLFWKHQDNLARISERRERAREVRSDS